MRFSRAFFSALLGTLFGLSAFAQSVVSARSGLVHFSEGSVFIGDRPLDRKFGTFPNIAEGSTLRTEQGRAEILLTPGVFLRVDENSSIRMLSEALSDTRVEFLKGSIIVDSLDAPPASPVLVLYQDSKIQFRKPGIYRFDSDPAPLFQTYSGEAAILHNGESSTIDTSHLFFFAAGTETKKFDDGADDDFYAWARDRAEAVASENQLASQMAQDPGENPGDLGGGQPLPGDPTFGLGAPGYSPSLGLYSFGGTFFDPYVPFGMGYFGGYPVFPLFLSHYYRRLDNPRWPRKTRYPVLSPSQVGILRHLPSRPLVFAYRPLPGTARPVTYGVSRPAAVRLPHVAVNPIVGHR